MNQHQVLIPACRKKLTICHRLPSAMLRASNTGVANKDTSDSAPRSDVPKYCLSLLAHSRKSVVETQFTATRAYPKPSNCRSFFAAMKVPTVMTNKQPSVRGCVYRPPIKATKTCTQVEHRRNALHVGTARRLRLHTQTTSVTSKHWNSQIYANSPTQPRNNIQHKDHCNFRRVQNIFLRYGRVPSCRTPCSLNE